LSRTSFEVACFDIEGCPSDRLCLFQYYGSLATNSQQYLGTCGQGLQAVTGDRQLNVGALARPLKTEGQFQQFEAYQHDAGKPLFHEVNMRSLFLESVVQAVV